MCVCCIGSAGVCVLHRVSRCVCVCIGSAGVCVLHRVSRCVCVA